jgi:hypothetical protein
MIPTAIWLDTVHLYRQKLLPREQFEPDFGAEVNHFLPA